MAETRDRRGHRISGTARTPVVLAAALALVLVLTSCGGDAPANDGAASTTEASQARSGLVAKLPGAASIGDGYRLRANSFTEPPEPFDPATTTTTTATRSNVIDEHCPGARWPQLDAHPDVAGVEYVTFADDDDRTLTVGVAPLPPSFGRRDMTDLVAAIDDCGTITDDEGFAVATTTLHAEEVTGVGDYGIDIRSTSAVAAKGDPANRPMGSMGPISKRTYLFVVDDTLVAVVAEGGFDLDGLTTLGPDEDLVPAAAAATAERLQD